MPALPAGIKAPDFTLPLAPHQSISLADFKGHPLILVFYPADWSPVCSGELNLYNELLSAFQEFDQAQLVGISVDSPWCHQAFKEKNNLHFPLLADFEPKGEVAKRYGVYRDQDGTSERALFVIDKDGVIAWSYVSPINTNPGAEGILAALESLYQKR